jgi:hypothetical protein
MKYILIFVIFFFTQCSLNRNLTNPINSFGELKSVEHYNLNSKYYFRHSLDAQEVIQLVKGGAFSKCDTLNETKSNKLYNLIFNDENVLRVMSNKNVRTKNFVDIRRVLVFNFESSQFVIGFSNVRARMQIGQSMYKANKSMIQAVSQLLEEE